MKTAVILHGTQGSPDGNWFRWLGAELERRGYTVWVPTLPHAERPSLREWLEFVRGNAPFTLTEDTLVVGHSSGAVLALVLAQESAGPLATLVLVSVFGPSEHPYAATDWPPNARLFDVPIHGDSVRDGANNRLTLHTDNDPYVPLAVARRVAGDIDADLVVLPGQGHFNLENSAQYKAFPALLELLKERKLL